MTREVRGARLPMFLHRYVDDAARDMAGRVAIEEPGVGRVSYGELGELSDRVRDRLVELGVRRGDRVALCMRKSIDAVASILGILKTGAAYVPLDPASPAARNGYIASDCAVAALLVEERLGGPLRAELARFGPEPSILLLPGVGAGAGVRAALDAARPQPPVASSATPDPDDLAYLLYTSGSTGRPKGVMLSHRAAAGFVEWCRETFEPRSDDRFSSHAPFHFDLSILDLYLPQSAGAALVLVGEEQGKQPTTLGRWMAEQRISVWYSAPSILALLAQHGRLEACDLASLRLVLFAGEVFPIVHLRALTRLLPHPRYFNLYGPTETNVCTNYELPARVPDERKEPFPIGKVCAHLEGVVVDASGAPVARGQEGELCIRGPAVMSGYWNQPEQTQRAYLEHGGSRWYRTGDLVAEDADGNYLFLGRRDRMVKRRGYRVELGEIEACLYQHPKIAEAAVVALHDDESGVRLIAHLATREGERLSMIALKRFCAERLPVYMVPDELRFHAALPRTSTDKVDYQRLLQS